MKKIAGTLKLDLAQFREVEEFTKFGSSVDEATRNLLARGQRLVEVLIQPALTPMKMEDQILSIYAGVNGYLDVIALHVIAKYEQKLHEFFKGTKLYEDSERKLGVRLDN
jgi:F-type H+-transporting ATPase subunit alpha